MADPITVAVTGLHRGDNPQPGASVIRSIRRIYPDIRIVGLAYDPLESGLYSSSIDRVDSIYLLPFPLKGTEILLDRMAYIQEKENIQYLVPCLDSEIANFVFVYPELRRMGITALLPTKEALDMRSKERLAEFCARNAIPGPRTLAANDVATLARFAADLGYPVYVKGRYYDAALVYTEADLAERFDQIIRVWGTPVLVQEAMVGDEFDYVGLANERSEIVGFCAIRKLLRTTSGKGFGGVVIGDPRIEAAAKTIIKRLGWRGPFEIEFLKVPRRPHLLFEINPRFPAWVDFPAQIGCNLPACLFEMLRGKITTKLERCEVGQMFVRHSLDLVADIAELAKLSSDGEYAAGPTALNPEIIA